MAGIDGVQEENGVAVEFGTNIGQQGAICGVLAFRTAALSIGKQVALEQSLRPL